MTTPHSLPTVADFLSHGSDVILLACRDINQQEKRSLLKWLTDNDSISRLAYWETTKGSALWLLLHHAWTGFVAQQSGLTPYVPPRDGHK